MVVTQRGCTSFWQWPGTGTDASDVVPARPAPLSGHRCAAGSAGTRGLWRQSPSTFGSGRHGRRLAAGPSDRPSRASVSGAAGSVGGRAPSDRVPYSAGDWRPRATSSRASPPSPCASAAGQLAERAISRMTPGLTAGLCRPPLPAQMRNVKSEVGEEPVRTSSRD